MPQKPTLTRAQVDSIARLACLSLDDAEADTLAKDLGAILKYFEELDGLDTTSVSPTVNVRVEETKLRDDEVRPGVTHEEALAQAPRVAEGCFAVPTFVDSEGTSGR